MQKELVNCAMTSEQGQDKLAELERRAAKKTRILEAALQAISEPFLLVNRSLRIEEVNEAMALRLGLGRERLLGENPLVFLPPDKQRQVKAQVNELLLAKTAKRFDLAVRGRWYEVSLSPVVCDGGQVDYVALFARDITDRRELEELMRFQAYHDPMTKLPNRRWLDEHLTKLMALAKRHMMPLTVMFFDLDGMKRVNDTHGHGVGDELLKEVSRRLDLAIRASDLLVRLNGESAAANVVSRIGGDEFVLVLSALEKREDAEQVAERLLGAIGEPFLVGGQSIRVSGSIGIVFLEDVTLPAEELLYQADQAMYLAKFCGRGRWCFADDVVDRGARAAREFSLA